MMDEEHVLALPNGYRLGKYCFNGVLGSGGFGITYLAQDTSLDRKVAIKEMLPNDFATRLDGTTVVAKTQTDKTNLDWARARFLDEGKALAACDHPNVIDVYEMIEANGTAYMVTQFQEGCNLEKWFHNLQRRPTERELRDILFPLLSGLEKVHRAGFLHRDIKPDNIYITVEGRPVLLDFGSARQAVRGRSMVMTSIVTPGYAPFEQYHEDGDQGPWTDIYALGAVMYRGVTGKKPPESIRRVASDTCENLTANYLGQYRSNFLGAIDLALRLKESERPQTVAAWRERLGSDTANAPSSITPLPNPSAGSRLPQREQEQWETQDLSSKLQVNGTGATTQADSIENQKSGRQIPSTILPFIARYRAALVAVAAILLMAGVIGIIFMAWPRPNALTNNLNGSTQNNDVKPTPTPSPSPVVALVSNPPAGQDKQSTAFPVRTPSQDSNVVTPTGGPISSPMVEPVRSAVTPPPVTDNPPTVTTPAGTETPSVVEQKLVGKWLTHRSHIRSGGTETWDIQTDGTYTLSGATSESGTLSSTDTKIEQSFKSTGKTLELNYRFDGANLVTTSPDGTETKWTAESNAVHPPEDGNHTSTHTVERHRRTEPTQQPGLLDRAKKFFLGR